MRLLTETRIKRTNECDFVGKISNIKISPKKYSQAIKTEFPTLTGIFVEVEFDTEKKGRTVASYLLTKKGHFILGAN